MLNELLYASHFGSVFGDSAYRCRRCGQGPVMGSDGFMMNHCMNCGNWHSVAEPIDLGLGRLKEAFLNLVRKAKAATLCPLGASRERPELLDVSNS